MAQPTPYNTTKDFSQDEVNSVAGRSTVDTAGVDTEFANIETTLDEILVNLALIQRDDTEIANKSIGIEQLKSEVSIALNTTSVWGEAKDYLLNEKVWKDNILYACLVPHTSDIFSTDLTSDKWIVLADFNIRIYKGDATGTANVITANLGLTALLDGTLVVLRAKDANTLTDPTFNPDGQGARTIFKHGNQPLASRDIPRSGYELILKYNLAIDSWELLNPVPVGASEFFPRVIYTDNAVSNNYVLTPISGQFAPQSLVDGSPFEFTVTVANTGAATLKVGSNTVKNLKNNDGNVLTPNYLLVGDIAKGKYNLSTDEYRLDSPVGGEYIKLTEVQAQGTAGGTFTQGVWQTKTLNVKDSDTGGNCTLTSNQFTLNAGTYDFEINSPAYAVNEHRAKLRNVTDSIDEIFGSSAYSSNASGGSEPSLIRGRVTIVASKTFEIQHQCAITVTGNGLGRAANFGGVTELYTIVEIKKVK